MTRKILNTKKTSVFWIEGNTSAALKLNMDITATVIVWACWNCKH